MKTSIHFNACLCIFLHKSIKIFAAARRFVIKTYIWKHKKCQNFCRCAAICTFHAYLSTGHFYECRFFLQRYLCKFLIFWYPFPSPGRNSGYAQCFFALCKPKGSRANEIRTVFARVQREIFEESDKNPAFWCILGHKNSKVFAASRR